MATKKKKADAEITTVVIDAPNTQFIDVTVRGTAPYVQQRFSQKAQIQMQEKMAKGDQVKKERKRPPRDFEADYDNCRHIDVDGIRHGIPAAAFRNAMIDACRNVGTVMKLAKQCVFTVANAEDAVDATPLVAFTVGEPRRIDTPVPNANGRIDIRVRARWDAGWEVDLRIKFDADHFDAASVINLLRFAGEFVGVGEGRAQSKMSNGVGWGFFEVMES